MRSLLFPALLLSSTLLVACEEGPRPPLKTAYSAPDGVQSDAAKGGWMAAGANARRGDTSSPTAGSIQIDERILKACGNIPTAHFAFDSVAISGNAATVLATLAKCFVSGPLTGAGLRILGHADPRGGVSYNIALGQQRAGSVASFLQQWGVDEGRMGTLSRGAFDANGIDEEGWALDRKVEVVLAD
jgi:peptidoglycan-associated lipoprotein